MRTETSAGSSQLFFRNHFREGFSNDKKNISDALNSIGFLYESMGNNQSALLYFQKALGIQLEISFKSGEAQSLLNISNILIKNKDFTQAKKYLDQSLEIGIEDNLKTVLKTANLYYSNLYFEKNDYKKQRSFYRVIHLIKR